MAKGKRRGNRRGDSSSEEEEGEEEASSKTNSKAVDFKERRELQRHEAAEKRRAKQRCNLCGKLGHVRRSCPGFEDDGRGESKFTKSKGDTGAVSLKTSGKKQGKQQDTMIPGLDLPDGFDPIGTTGVDSTDDEEQFLYYDAMCDGATTLQYLQTGRAGALFQKTKDEAVQEYKRILTKSAQISNFGGCLAQVYLKTNQSWTSEISPPLPWSEEESLPVYFIIGLNHGHDCLVEHRERSRAVLQAACENSRVVGLCAKLDYSDCNRDAQLARVHCTCEVAAQANLPVQIKLGARTENEEEDMALADLQSILEMYASLKVHLCSWSGQAADMMALLLRFPDRVWIGMDGAVSFSKATQAHECVFDVPLNSLLLETGSGIPASVASALGRQAFPHSGLIPYVAAAVAKHKKYISPEQVAKAASENTIQLYNLKRAGPSA